MKLSRNKLRKIVQEEVQKTQLNEAEMEQTLRGAMVQLGRKYPAFGPYEFERGKGIAFNTSEGKHFVNVEESGGREVRVQIVDYANTVLDSSSGDLNEVDIATVAADMMFMLGR